MLKLLFPHMILKYVDIKHEEISYNHDSCVFTNDITLHMIFCIARANLVHKINQNISTYNIDFMSCVQSPFMINPLNTKIFNVILSHLEK